MPDLPGYGASAPVKENDKFSVGKVVLAALKELIKGSSEQEKKEEEGKGDISVILVGHDRGARVAHRLAVSGYEGVNIKGICLVDIVSLPTIPISTPISKTCTNSSGRQKTNIS